MTGRTRGGGRGATLVELLVTLTVIGIVAGLATLALPQLVETPSDTPAARLVRARHEALTTGRPVSVTLARSDTILEATAAPDGSIVGDSALHLDRLTGRSLRDAR